MLTSYLNNFKFHFFLQFIYGLLNLFFIRLVRFVGAENRMEMERVPAAGYTIIGLPVAGFDRRNLLKNVSVAVKLLKSLRKAKTIVASFKPHIAVGVGGYASGPILRAAAAKGIPTVLQEQNSYAGVTNKMLAQKAAKICVAYEGMERFFPKEKRRGGHR